MKQWWKDTESAKPMYSDQNLTKFYELHAAKSFLKKLLVPQPVKKFSAHYEILRFSTARHLSLSLATSLQCTTPSYAQLLLFHDSHSICMICAHIAPAITLSPNNHNKQKEKENTFP